MGSGLQTPADLRGADFVRWLIALHGPATDRTLLERWWPIPWPEFRDLPPTLQMQLASAQMREERQRMAALGLA